MQGLPPRYYFTWEFVARMGLEWPKDRLGVDGDEEDEA